MAMGSDSVQATFDLASPSPAYAASRRALHAIAELVLAGPQYRRSGTIRLQVVENGVVTVAAPGLGIQVGDGVLRIAGSEFRIEADADALVTTTCTALAVAAGVEAGAPEGLYHDGSGVGPLDEIDFNPLLVSLFLDNLRAGNAALREFAPGETPVLWPEHFDVGVTVDEVNYGVSLGDSHLGFPYAYVGPWTARTGEFWNAPFGAARVLAELGGVAGIAAFFTEGRRLAADG
jgi:hypothetical protein